MLVKARPVNHVTVLKSDRANMTALTKTSTGCQLDVNHILQAIQPARRCPNELHEARLNGNVLLVRQGKTV